MVTKEIGARLARRRKELGLSQAEVSERIGYSREYLSMIESGKRLPNLEILSKLAEVYRMDVSALISEDKPASAFALLLRSGEVTAAERKSLVNFCNLCEDFSWLESQLQLRKRLAPEYRIPSASAWREQQELAVWMAEKERARLKLGEQPVGDIFPLMEQQGLRIIRICMAQSRLDGAFAYEEGKGAFALINASRTKGKQVFTTAHEYCHFLKDRSSGYQPCQIADDYLVQQRQKELERFSNLFATHFLMPEVGVREVVESHFGFERELGAEEVIYLKRYFAVSYQAMLVRLLELGYISEDRYRLLAQVKVTPLERRLYGESETDRQEQEPPPTVPPLLAVLALEAYNRGLISLPRLAEIWRMKSAEAKEVLAEAGYVVKA